MCRCRGSIPAATIVKLDLHSQLHSATQGNLAETRKPTSLKLQVSFSFSCLSFLSIPVKSFCSLLRIALYPGSTILSGPGECAVDDEDDEDSEKAAESPHAHGHSRGPDGRSLPPGLATDRGSTAAIFSAHIGRAGIRMASSGESFIPRGAEEAPQASMARSISDRFNSGQDRFSSGAFAVCTLKVSTHSCVFSLLLHVCLKFDVYGCVEMQFGM